MHKALKLNTQPEQPKQPFEDQQRNLLVALSQVPLYELSIGQLEVLDSIGIASNVGAEGVKQIEDTLFRHALDIATAAERVGNSVREVNEGVNWANEVSPLLDKILDTDAVTNLADQVLMRVHFTKNARFTNLSEFKDCGKTWWEIGRGIAMAHGKAPENIEIIGASKGSIIISLVSIYGIAKTTSSIIMQALKLIDKIYDIKKKAQEVRALELSNDEAEKSLEAAAKSERDRGVEEIVETTITDLSLERNKQGEAISVLTMSVKQLVEFIEKGGEVDFVVPEDADEEEGNEEDANRQEREQLRLKFKEVRLLEQKIKRLEHRVD